MTLSTKKRTKVTKVAHPLGNSSQTPRTPGKKVAPQPPIEKMEAAGISTTSELASKLSALGIQTKLAEAPRVYVAVLSKKGSNKTVSDIFTVQSHGESTCHSTLARLISGLTGEKIQKASHATCGLEFFLKREFEHLNKVSTVIPGTAINYVKPGRLGTTKNLGETVEIQIFKNNPYILDNDQATLATNKEIAKTEINTWLLQHKTQEMILKSGAELETHTQQLGSELLRDL